MLSYRACSAVRAAEPAGALQDRVREVNTEDAADRPASQRGPTDEELSSWLAQADVELEQLVRSSAESPVPRARSELEQRLLDVDSRLEGPNLPHKARFLDSDCLERPCVVALFIPSADESADGRPDFEARKPHIEEVVREFGEWLDVDGELERMGATWGVHHDIIVTVWVRPDDLDAADAADRRDALKPRAERMGRPSP